MILSSLPKPARALGTARHAGAAWLLAALLTLVGFARAVVAQTPAPAAPKPAAATAAKPARPSAEEGQDKSPGVKVERDASGQKVYRITDAVVIEGKVQKPNAFYVLQRSSINYDWAELKEDFVPKIVDAVRRHPF